MKANAANNYSADFDESVTRQDGVDRPDILVPARTEHITPAWLTAILAQRYPEVSVNELDILQTTQGAATRLRIAPHYAPGGDGGLPMTLFVKSCLTKRMLVADPHMYITEVRFFDEIRYSVNCETPGVFGSAVNETSGRFALVLEDLTRIPAHFPTAHSGLTVSQLYPLMKTLATLHAAHWGAPGLRTRYPWLETSLYGKTATWWREKAIEFARFELGQSYKQRALGTDLTLEQVFAGFSSVQAVNEHGPSTVIHGDCHIGNCYLLPDGGFGVLDWQLARIASWANDVAYAIVTALDSDSRRRGERDLLLYYLEELRQLGVEAPPFDDAWDVYRKQMVWGVATWMVTPTSMYDAQLLETLIQRSVRAAHELETFGLLGVTAGD